jgi:hypothetical protein
MEIIRSERSATVGSGSAALPVFPFLARGLIVLSFVGWTTGTFAAELASHRAVYDLQLSATESSADIAGLSGRMVLEWSGNSCDGYTLNQRLVTQMSDTDGGVAVRDLRMASWESGEGDQFRYEVKRFAGSQLEETVSGFAERSVGTSSAVFSEPDGVELDLPQDVIFPSEFVRDLVATAVDGKSLMTASVFEGAETDRYYVVSSFIGKPSDSAALDTPTMSGEGQTLTGAPSWPVQVSYFLPNDNEGLPDYQVSYRLFANGVSSNMRLDYGDIVIDGLLKEVTYLAQEPC